MLATVLTDAHRFGPAHYGLPSLYLMTHDDRPDTLASPPPSQDDIVTRPHASDAPLADTQPPEADDAAAEAAMETMLPPGKVPLIDASDSYIGHLLAEIATAARVISEEREERRRFAVSSATNQDTIIDQQNQIIRILDRTEKSTEANSALLQSAIRRLEANDTAHEHRLEHHAQQIDDILRQIEQLKLEMMAALPEAVSKAVEQFAERIEALEKQLLEISDPAARTPET